MPSTPTTIVLGRGDLYFDRFDPGTTLRRGEFYLGNTLDFTISVDSETADRFTSYGGQKVQQEGAIIREMHRASFTTDHIDIENVALWFGSAIQPTSYAPQGLISETFVAKKNRYYQLGMSRIPIGAKYVETVTAKVGVTSIPVSGNFEVDYATGRIRVADDAPDIVEGNSFTISFEWREQTLNVVAPGKREQFGSLRFISTNPKGPQKNYFYPMVKLSASGDVDLKRDSDWQKLKFDAEARRLNAMTDYVYVEEFVSASVTSDELAIQQYGGIEVEDFPYWEDDLNTFVNTTMPSHSY